MRLNLSNNGSAVLQSDISGNDTIITVDSTEALPEVPFPLTLNMTEEIVYVTAVDGNKLTVERGQEGTESKAYPSGTELWLNFTSGAYKGLVHKDEIPVRVTDDDTLEYLTNAGEWVELKGGGSSIKVGNVSGLSIEPQAGLVIEVAWSDPNDIVVDGVPIAEWAGTQLRGKIGSYPINEKDGELIVDNTERDKYADNPFKHEGLTEGDEWFYMLFPYTKDGAFTVDSSNRVKATAVYKFTQEPPSTPEVIGITHEKATVTGGDLVSINKSEWFPSPHTFEGLEELTTYTAYAKYEETDTYYESDASEKAFETTEEILHPGPPSIAFGDEAAGFYGEVPASDLFDADEIASACGITQGTAHNKDVPWIKFIYEGKIYYRPRKSIRYSISYDEIEKAECVKGGKIIEKDGQRFAVHLMKGATEDPAKTSSDRDAPNSWWNKIILPLSERAIDQSWRYKTYVTETVPAWRHGFGSGKDGMYTDDDLGFVNGYGFYHWCQEHSTTSGYRVYRADNASLTYANYNMSGNKGSNYGWAPVLEILE